MTTETEKTSGLSVLANRSELDSWREGLSSAPSPDKRPLIGLVPTMGALHQGHMALIRRAKEECRNLVVSIFVNPLQFAPNEDFAKYPRTFDADRKLCEAEGVDVIFHPTVDVMYPGGQEGTTRVVPPPVLEQSLYGQFRPPFFSGVATVVTRLFNLVRPDVAYFGEKDFQQLVVIKKMVHDLQIPVQIAGVETVRESDGLAFSSRNVFLDVEQRRAAPELQATLQEIKAKCLQHPNDLTRLLDEGKKRLGQLRDVDLKYLVACDVHTLEELKTARFPMVLLVAAKFREVWLIDTLVVRK